MNFFREHEAKKQKSSRKQWIVGGIVIALVAVLAFSTMYLITSRNDIDRRVDGLERELSAAQMIRPQLWQEQATLALYQEIRDILVVMDHNISLLNFFDAEDAQMILESFPYGVLLHSVEIRGLDVVIEGEIEDMYLFASLMENLENTGLFYYVTPSRAEIRERTVIVYQLPDGIYVRIADDRLVAFADDGTLIELDEVREILDDSESIGSFQEDVVLFTITCLLVGGDF